MPNFKNFANGEMGDVNPSEFTSIRHRQVRDLGAGSRMEKVWAVDFDRCESREDFERYILKYGRYESNKYIAIAKAKIESLDAAEKARIEREKVNQRVQQRPIPPGTGGSGVPPRNKIIQNFIKVAVWILVIGSVGLYSYMQYRKENKEKATEIVVNPQPSQNQSTQEEYPAHTHSEQPHQQENPVVESEPAPQEIWWDCNICGTTGRCQLCFGSGRCAVCGGGGQVFSAFDGGEVVPGRMTDCGNCGGSGACPSCEGSGACFACHGQGRVKSEF